MKKINKFLKPSIIVLLLIITFFSFYDFITQTNLLNTNKVQIHLQDVGRQEANNFNQQFDNYNNIIKGASSLISDGFKSQKDIENILENIRIENNYFQRIWYLDENKNLNNYKENIVFKTQHSFVDDLFKGNSGITDVFTSSYNNKNIVAIYSPVIRNNYIVGGVVGVFEINQINNEFIYTDFFEDKAYVFTVNKEGNIIDKIRNENTLYFGNNFYNFLKEDITFLNGDFQQVIKDTSTNKSNFIKYETNNESRMAFYTPLKFNDWYIYTVITTDFINEQTDSFNKITIELIIKLLIVFIIIFSFIIRYFYKVSKKNIDINNKLKSSNKKIDIVLKQISDRIFEYDIEKDTIVLDSWNDYPKIMLNNFLLNLHNYNFVCKEDENLLKDNFYSIGVNNKKVEFDAKLPYISKDYDTWYHISMIFDEESGHAIGTLKNSTKEMKEYLDLLQDNMFKNSVYSHSLFMFAVNMKSKKIVIYQKNGEYHSFNDTEYDDYIFNRLFKNIHKKDKERIKSFFDYQNIITLYNNKNKRNKIDFRYFDDSKQKYIWVNTRIQFERESNNNELLMIVYALDIDEEKKKQLEIEFLAQRDGLTEIYNRKTFNGLVDNYISIEKTKFDYSAYMILDLDNFKNINDNLGHSIGDKVLKEVADILEDINEINGYVGRFGGDEFVIFLYDQKSYNDIEDKCMKIIKTIKKINIKGNISISASIGVCFVSKEKNHQELFDKADKALYQIKNSGKNNYHIYYEGLIK